MATHANRVQMTVTGTPGTGTITLNAASSGYQTFGSAHGANATVDCLFTDGTAWEVARDCTYTHSGTTLSRGTLEASSTGSAISLTSAAVVSQILTADRGRQLTAAALDHVAGTDANTTMVVNTMYVVDMSAWATADRTYTLPATAAVGDRVGIMVSSGDASHELLITAASGDTLNGVAGGTEWSRVFITGEVVVMRCVVANTTWVVEQDGRIPQKGSMFLTTDATGEAAATLGLPTSRGGAWTGSANVGDVSDTSVGKLTARRAGVYNISATGRVVTATADQKYFQVEIYLNNTTSLQQFSTWASGASATAVTGGVLPLYALAAGDYVQHRYRSEEGSKGCRGSGAFTGFSMLEVL